ncbi:hypothetical protein NL676_032380 [Syzygium grande]|nr:hypothetical protein NL676_032380 [Syzygium grande]
MQSGLLSRIEKQKRRVMGKGPAKLSSRVLTSKVPQRVQCGGEEDRPPLDGRASAIPRIYEELSWRKSPTRVAAGRFPRTMRSRPARGRRGAHWRTLESSSLRRQ